MSNTEIVKTRNGYQLECSYSDIVQTTYNNTNYYSFETKEKLLYIQDPIITRNNVKNSILFSFDKYYELNDREINSFEFNSHSYYFDIRNHQSLFQNFDVARIEIKECDIVFSRVDHKFCVSIEGNEKDISKMNDIGIATFFFLFFLTGEFIEQYNYSIFSEGETEVKQYFLPLFEDVKCNRYTKFSLPTTSSLFKKFFEKFYYHYQSNIYPLTVFLNSQTDVKFQIQQRVSLILNSLEGIIKRNMSKASLKLDISKSNRKRLRAAIKENALDFIKSKEFESEFEDFFEEEINMVMDRLSNSLGHFTDFTFDEALDFSKTINRNGLFFVRLIKNTGVMFWKRCKDHRNFHAHLTDDYYKGFDGIQSYFAVMILSNYFRLLSLELIGISSIDKNILTIEANNIKDWISTNLLSNQIDSI